MTEPRTSNLVAPETNRDKAMRREVVEVSAERLREMREQAIRFEGFGEGTYHWHWVAAMNELIAKRAEIMFLRREYEIDGNDKCHLNDEIHKLTAERDEWARKWHEMRAKYAELRYPGMKGVIKPTGTTDETTVAQTGGPACANPVGNYVCPTCGIHVITENYNG